MTSAEGEYAVNFGNHYDSLLEQNNVHLSLSRLVVKVEQRLVQLLFKFAHVINLRVNLQIVEAEEIDKNGVKESVLILHSSDMLVEVHWEVYFQGVVEDVAEFAAIQTDTRDFSEAILEDSLDLVSPEFDHFFLGIIELTVSLEDSLEYFRNITHVELVMAQ